MHRIVLLPCDCSRPAPCGGCFGLLLHKVRRGDGTGPHPARSSPPSPTNCVGEGIDIERLPCRLAGLPPRPHPGSHPDPEASRFAPACAQRQAPGRAPTRVQERMNSPLERHEVRLRGLLGRPLCPKADPVPRPHPGSHYSPTLPQKPLGEGWEWRSSRLGADPLRGRSRFLGRAQGPCASGYRRHSLGMTIRLRSAGEAPSPQPLPPVLRDLQLQAVPCTLSPVTRSSAVAGYSLFPVPYSLPFRTDRTSTAWARQRPGPACGPRRAGRSPPGRRPWPARAPPPR